MKKTAILFLLATLFACDDGNDGYYNPYTYDDETIYTETNKTLFTEVVGFISPYIIDNNVKKYIVTKSIHQIVFKISKNKWVLESSYEMNPELIEDKELVGKYWVSKEKISYPIVLNVKNKSTDLSTAGDYAELINDYRTFAPGNYICQIESFELLSEGGANNVVNTPTLAVLLEVKENQGSSNIGNFDILIKQ